MAEGFYIQPVDLRHADALFHALDFDSVYRFIARPRPRNSDEVRARIKKVIAGPNPESGHEWLNFLGQGLCHDRSSLADRPPLPDARRERILGDHRPSQFEIHRSFKAVRLRRKVVTRSGIALL